MASSGEGGGVAAGWERDEATGKLRPVKGEMMSFMFGDNAPAGEDDFMAKKGAPSLQEGFKGFRKAKIKAARNRAVVEKQEGELRKDPAQMQQLRELFVDRCKSYYGVPYHARYHDASDPCKCGKDGCTLFQSPIFLDCCGLVRQVCICMGVASAVSVALALAPVRQVCICTGVASADPVALALALARACSHSFPQHTIEPDCPPCSGATRFEARVRLRNWAMEPGIPV